MRRVEHQVVPGRARRPGNRTAVAEVCKQVQEGSDPRLVGIVDDEHADGRRQKLDSDRAACTTGPDKECPCPFHVSSMACLRLHEVDAV